MKSLTLDELQELLKLAFNKGLSVGKKIKPLSEIPMGSLIPNLRVEFEEFFKETILDLNEEGNEIFMDSNEKTRFRIWCEYKGWKRTPSGDYIRKGEYLPYQEVLCKWQTDYSQQYYR